MNGLIDEIFVKLGFKVEDKELKNADKNIKSTLASLRTLALGVSAAVIALDRMATSLARNNQSFINFTRQTGLAINQLNKVAGAGMLADFNFNPEKAISGLQAIQSNLAAISIGQGNIAPYQILGINPLGKDATQILEDLRVALRGVDDAMATNLIQQMGLSPEFLSILRMTRSEFEDLSATARQFMLNDEERSQMATYAIELRKIHMQLIYLKDKALIAIMPYLIKFMQGFTAIVELFARASKAISDCKGALIALGVVAGGLLIYFKPIIALFTALYLILEDIAVWALGGKSLLGLGLDFLGKKIEEWKTAWGGLFKGGQDGFDSFLVFLKNIGKMPVPPIIQSLLTLVTLLKAGFTGVEFAVKGTREEQAIQSASMNGGMGQISSNRVINQTNNITLPDGSPETVANEINDLTFAHAQMVGVYA